MFRCTHLAIVVAACATVASAATYNLAENNVGSSFYNNFAFNAIADPTHGRVQYVDEATAKRNNLTYATGDSFIVRADSRTYLNANGPGRQSVRLVSRRQYTTQVIVADVRHLPQGCGTWPAIWSFSDPWPYNGEVDIVEGVNDQESNQSALHTSAGCTMNNLQQTGTLLHSDCNVAVDGNTGCTVKTNQRASFGPAFNNAGGGIFAMERTPTSIKVWFWPRNSQIPSDVSSGAGSVNPASWGTPYASFNNASCDIASKFAAHNILINLTLCGDWAGQDAIWYSSPCGSLGSCVAYVNNNPGAFQNAYFDFKALRVYT